MEEKRERLEIPAEAVGRAGGNSEVSADAETATSAAPVGEVAVEAGPTTAPGSIEEQIVAQLRQVYDPEIPVNIYDLGLIYDIKANELGDVEIKMTLTAPGCPVAGEMPGMVEVAARRVEAVTTCDVELLWDPPWNPDMMSEDARLTLNI